MRTWDTDQKMREDWLNRCDIQKEIDFNKKGIKIECCVSAASTLLLVLTILFSHSWMKFAWIVIFAIIAFYALVYAIEMQKDVFVLEDIKSKEEGIDDEKATEERHIS